MIVTLKEKVTRTVTVDTDEIGLNLDPEVDWSDPWNFEDDPDIRNAIFDRVAMRGWDTEIVHEDYIYLSDELGFEVVEGE